MATKTITITRRSRVGYGYTSACERDEHGHTQVCSTTTRPVHVGTVRQVCVAIDTDRTLASFKSGGTYYSDAWFVRLNNRWVKIPWNKNYQLPPDLLETYPEQTMTGRWEASYTDDAIQVEVEA